MGAVNWPNYVWLAMERARRDVQTIDPGRREEWAAVNGGYGRAMDLIDGEIDRQGAREGLDAGKFIAIETSVLAEPRDGSPAANEQLHAARRIFTYIREYLARDKVEIPDNFTAYAGLDKVPSLIDKGKAAQTP